MRDAQIYIKNDFKTGKITLRWRRGGRVVISQLGVLYPLGGLQNITAGSKCLQTFDDSVHAPC